MFHEMQENFVADFSAQNEKEASLFARMVLEGKKDGVRIMIRFPKDEAPVLTVWVEKARKRESDNMIEMGSRRMF